MSTPQITPSIIHQESFTDLDFVTIILEALLYDDLITMDQYHDALESYQTIYLRLLNCFRCTPQQFYSVFGRDEHEVYLDDFDGLLRAGSTVASLVRSVTTDVEN